MWRHGVIDSVFVHCLQQYFFDAGFEQQGAPHHSSASLLAMVVFSRFMPPEWRDVFEYLDAHCKKEAFLDVVVHVRWQL